MHMSFTGERYVPELRGQIYYEHFHRYAMVLELARDKDVLDIACGEGYGTGALSLVARSAVGVDLDGDSVRHAAARYTAMNVTFRTGDCTQIPAGDASFDLAVSFETIEHLTEQERMLGELRRVLRPNGLLVISSPNKLIYSDGRSYQNPFHQRELYFHEFRDMLRSFFPKVRIFGQRVFAASAVHPLRGTADETRWLGPSTVAEGTLGALPDPEYFVAICGGSEDDELADLCSVYLDPRDELLADIRSGGLATAHNGSQTALEAPAPAGILTSGAQQLADDVDRRLTELQIELAKVEQELAGRVVQVKAMEDHAVGIEVTLNAERQRSTELAASVEARAEELARERETTTRLAGELAQQRETASGFAAELAQQREAMTRSTVELDQQRGTESALGAEMTQLREAAGTLAADLAQEREAQNRLNDELAQAREAANRLNAELEQAREAANRLNADLAQERESAKRLNADLAHERQGASRLNAELAQEREAVTRLNAELAKGRESVSRLSVDLRRERDAIARLEADRQQQNQLLAARVAELAGERDAVTKAEAGRREEHDLLVTRLAKLAQERDAVTQLEAARQEEARLLAVRVGELENLAVLAEERRATLERTLAVLTEEREQLEATVQRTHDKSTELRDERARLERQAAGLGLERDSLREALAEQRSRQAGELRTLEEALLVEREKLGFEITTVREENLQLRREVVELSSAAARQPAADGEVFAALDQARREREGAAEARRDAERLHAQLKLERLNYDELAKRHHEVESVLQDVLGSTSWRLTLPARRFMSALRGRGNG